MLKTRVFQQTSGTKAREFQLPKSLALPLLALILSACATAPGNNPSSQGGKPVSDCACTCPATSATDGAQSCPASDKPTTQQDRAPEPALVQSDFKSLPGWASMDHAQWLTAFAEQCHPNNDRLGKRGTTPEALLALCKQARSFVDETLASPGNTAQPNAKQTLAREWMQGNLAVWQLQKEDGSKTGLLTGYYEPELKGSRTRHGPYQHPLHAEPSDLITVELASLDPDLKGKRLRGRLQGNKLVPYFDRASWERLGQQREEALVWINDPLDAFLLQVQGSGRVKLDTGDAIRLGYANQNGHPYKSIGKTLVDRGELTVEQATIPGIRNWAKRNPGKLQDLLNSNPSVVFFQENAVLRPQDGPVGALGIPLTPKLSLAVDRQRIPYGTLLWINSSNPVTQQAIQQGALAQDTGGAIRGRVRADYFAGTGTEAGELAGLMRQTLEMWILWPKGEAPPSIQ